MVKLWSEVPGSRRSEIVADVATVLWVLFWGRAAWQVYSAIAGFADAGRTINEGGTNLTRAGADIGASLAEVPLVGEGLSDIVAGAFAGAGQPLAEFGEQLEAFVLIVAAALALLLALIVLVPWLARYLPWRWRRIRAIGAAHRAIRRPSAVPDPGIEEILALRAVTRLDYPTLLEFTPDPLGDWAAGRHDRLARAELASVGLTPA